MARDHSSADFFVRTKFLRRSAGHASARWIVARTDLVAGCRLMRTQRFGLPALWLGLLASTTASSASSAGSPEPAEWLSAVGSFRPTTGTVWLSLLHAQHANWWLLVGPYLMSVRPERHGANMVLPLSWPASAASQLGDDLPREMVFSHGPASKPGWRYRADGAKGEQLVDALAARVLARGESVELVRLGDGRARATFLRCVEAWRTPTAERLRAFTQGLAPDVVTALGGAEQIIANQLANVLADVAETAPADQRADLQRKRASLEPNASGHPRLWPASEDARLLALISARFRSHDVIELRDGWLMKLDQHDQDHDQRCQAGWAIPAPPGSSQRRGQPVRTAEPRRVTRLLYEFSAAGAAMKNGDPQCAFDPLPGHAYERAGGFPFYLFVDGESRIVGAQIVGYLRADLFVVPGLSEDLLRAVGVAAREAADRQAE
jgi:hypothetical protein